MYRIYREETILTKSHNQDKDGVIGKRTQRAAPPSSLKSYYIIP